MRPYTLVFKGTSFGVGLSKIIFKFFIINVPINCTYLKCPVWWILTYITKCETIMIIKIINTSIPPNVFLHLLWIHPSLLYTSLSGNRWSVLCYYRLVCIFLEIYINGFIPYVLFFGQNSITQPNCFEIHPWCVHQ